MNEVLRGPIRSTFKVAPHGETWRVLLNGLVYGDFETRGDAVRGACMGARAADAKGFKAEVVAGPGNGPFPHYEPHFGA